MAKRSEREGDRPLTSRGCRMHGNFLLAYCEDLEDVFSSVDRFLMETFRNWRGSLSEGSSLNIPECRIWLTSTGSLVYFTGVILLCFAFMIHLFFSTDYISFATSRQTCLYSDNTDFMSSSGDVRLTYLTILVVFHYFRHLSGLFFEISRMMWNRKCPIHYL